MAKRKSSKRTGDRRAFMPENTPENRLAGRVGGQPRVPGQEYLGDTGRSRSEYEQMQQRAWGKINRSQAALKNKSLSKAGKSAKNPAARAAQTPYKTALQQFLSMSVADVSKNNPPDWQ